MSKLKIDKNADFEQVLLLIQEARSRVFSKANAELVMLYFNVGKMVSQKVNQGIWGDAVVDELAKHIEIHLPELTGFNRRGLYRMKQFFEIYNIDSECFLLWLSVNNSIVSPAATQLENTEMEKVSPAATQMEMHNNFLNNILLKISWTNHLEIFSSIKKSEEILFYVLMSLKEIVSTLPTQLPQNLFKDPYIFEFLDLPDTHSEKDLEKALIQNLQKFILEVGKGFTYMGNQYRLQVGNKDYYTDLLFYHRDLQCLVLFELKIEDFAPEFLGKLNFYLEALDRDVKRPNEKPSIGILLCKGKDTEVVEYAMARNTSPALIADYETKLIDKKLLAQKLHQLSALFKKDID